LALEKIWNGEKVKFPYRVLATIAAIIFSLLPILGGYVYIETGKNIFGQFSVWNLLTWVIQIYIGILVIKIALTGHAPKTFLPWK